MDLRFTADSPLGRICLSSDGTALTGLWFEDAPPAWAEQAVSAAAPDLVTKQALDWLARCFGGLDPGFTPPLRLRGTPFQRAVWALLQEIPFGCRVSYGQLAARLCEKQGLARTSARAVGAAVGKNPVLLIVPCHRVVGADGSLTGYAGGLARKRALLELEARAAHGMDRAAPEPEGRFVSPAPKA